MNPTKEPVRAELTRRGAWAAGDPAQAWELEDVMSGEKVSLTDKAAIDLAGASLRMLRVLSGPLEAARVELGRAG
jgi:hypothetical protein